MMMRTTCTLVAVAAVATGSCAHRLRGANPEVGVSLPADHAAHDDAQTEWWHFHGHVVDDQGRRYDFFLGFVKEHTDLDRVAGVPVRWFVDPFQVAYYTLTDRAAGEFYVAEKHAFPDTWAASASTARLALRHDSWSARDTGDGAIAISARSRTTRVDLALRAAKPAALLGDHGYLEVPPRSSHYYYSFPRMVAEGTITIDGEPRRVHGLGWFKHEWGFLYTDHLKGWVWFGVQLSSGEELEIGLIFDHDWNLADGAFAVVEERDGTVTPIDVHELEVEESGDTWRSGRTGTVYPTSWRLVIPGRGTLSLKAAVAGQEMVVFPANLWAGGLTVEGVFDDQPVTGDCFTEVVGLDEPFGRSLLRTGRPRRWEPVQPRDDADGVDPLAPPPGGVAPDAGPPITVVTPPPPDAPAPSSAETAAAAETYRLRCAPCHGPDGRGDGPAAPALDPPPRDFSLAAWQAGITDDQIERAILDGGAAVGRSPAMPANPDLVGEPATVEALRRMLRAFGSP